MVATLPWCVLVLQLMYDILVVKSVMRVWTCFLPVTARSENTRCATLSDFCIFTDLSPSSSVCQIHAQPGGCSCCLKVVGSAGDLGSCLQVLHHPYINSYSRKIARASPCCNLGGSLLSWALLVSSTRAGTFPCGRTCTVEAGRFAVNQSMSLLIYSSIRKLQAWQMHNQIYSSVYRDPGDFLPPFLAIVSRAGKKDV